MAIEIHEASPTPAPVRSRARVLLVDDDQPTLELLRTLLATQEYAVTAVTTGEEAIRVLSSQAYDLVLLDLHLPGVTGHQVLAQIRALEADVQAIVMTGYATIDSAVEAMRLGAFDYITKPLRTDELMLSMERALEKASLHREVASLRRRAGTEGTFVGNAPAVQHMFDLIERVAPLTATVLITGETGTGKELVARAIHDLSPRSGRPFVPVQCSALAPTLIESELFGHVKGSFTGAVAHRRGLFEEAGGGTLFLDEIATITPDIQVKILRVLQDRRIQRVGASEQITVDFRLIGATNVDLAQEAAGGRFREDLYYRLSVFPIRVPPLRERREDIPHLAAAFRARFARENGIEAPEISPRALARMMEYDWPGNVRELENFIERAMIVHAGRRSIQFEPPGRRERAELQLLGRSEREEWPMERLEREYVLNVLERVHGHQGRAATILGISRRTLSRKLGHWKVARSEPTPDAE